jgi:DhnA family fructose-bisphosphate aldolase class Ia
MTATSGKAIRLGRLLPGEGYRGACFAFDHGLQVGPIAGTEDLRTGVQLAVDAGFEAIILAPGAITKCADLLAPRTAPAVIMRVDQTNMWRIGSQSGYSQGYTRQIATVEEAAQMGADAVISYFFTAHTDPNLEDRSMEIAAKTATDARRLGLVYVAEPMAARSGLMTTPFDGEVVAMNTRMAVEMGADVIKADWPGSEAACKHVVSRSGGAPVLMAGGERSGSDADVLALVAELLAGGAKGVMFGRSLFQSAKPLVLMRAVRAMIHDGLPLAQALSNIE